MQALQGGNIFAAFSALAAKHGAANMGQGFPTFGAPPQLGEFAQATLSGDCYADDGGMPDNWNMQYTRPGGEPSLLHELALRYSPLYEREIDPMLEIVTVVGAQEGL